MSLKKIDYTKMNLNKWIDKLKCPHCEGTFELHDTMIKCQNNHSYNISKQGTIVFHEGLKEDKMYTKELFSSRRSFMETGFFVPVYHQLLSFINANDFVIDMGSGEGTHNASLQIEMPLSILGLDLAKEGIRMASDFNHLGLLSVVADLAHMPVQDHCVDVILNILSPSNEDEMLRALKPSGTILKVVPRHDYLKELREAQGLEDYEPNEPNFKKLEVIERIPVNYSFPLSPKMFNDLVGMTPLMNNRESISFFERITVDVELWVLKVK